MRVLAQLVKLFKGSVNERIVLATSMFSVVKKLKIYICLISGGLNIIELHIYANNNANKWLKYLRIFLSDRHIMMLPNCYVNKPTYRNGGCKIRTNLV